MTKTLRTLIVILGAVAIAALPLAAQTVTPSTTFCAAVTATATSVCLASTTSVVNQTGLYVDGEFMLVQLSANQTIGTTNAYVPVSRGNRAGATPPIAHNSGAVVWKALTPGASVVPGANGFVYSTQMGDQGPCTRASNTYLPHVWPDRNIMRDCNGTNWVDYNSANNTVPGVRQLTLLSASGAVTVSSGTYVITKAGVAALTLAAPTAGVQDGTIINISSTTTNAHTLTATGLLQTGVAGVDLATFAAFGGAGLTLMAYNGKWVVLYSVGITFS